MSFSGGTFSINTTGQPVVSGTTISASVFNSLTADLATGLSTCMLKDGTQTATAGIGFFAGTVSLPGITFGTDTATGLYRIGLNNVGYAVNGTKLLDMTGTTLAVTSTVTANTIGVTSGTTATLFNTAATTFNLGGAATTISMGAATGTMTVNNTTLAAKAGTFSAATGTVAANSYTGVSRASITGFVRVHNIEGTDASLQLYQTTTGTSWELANDDTGLFRILNAGTNRLTITAAGLVTVAAVNASGAVNANLVTDATSISTGSLLTAGGLAVTKALWVGGLANIAGAVTLQSTLAAGQTALGTSPTLGGVGGGAARVAIRSNQTVAYGIEISTTNDQAAGFFTAFVNASNATQGSIQATNSTTTAYATSSDKRKKKDLGICVDVSVLLKTKVHDFQWIENDSIDRGVFAQDAVLVCPRAILHNEKADFWGADYSKYVPDLIVGWQSHESRIAALEAKLENA